MSNNIPTTAKETMEMINKLEVLAIPEHEIVRQKYIQNYNACNPGGNGEFMYQRNLVYLMQILNSTASFKSCSPFSVYACMTTIAAYGYSIDPADGHIYLIPRDGRLCISKQAGAHLMRLYKTNQITYNGEATLIYEGDNFTKKNGLIDHEECYKSEKIIGGYVKFTLDKNGTQRHISYKLSDIEGWRAKSPQKDGSNWRFEKTGQPHPGFLRTKIMLHACTEKCWIPGNSPMTDEVFDVFTEDIEVEVLSSDTADQQEKLRERIQTEEEEAKAREEHEATQKQAEPAAKPSFLRPSANRSAQPAETVEDKPF